MTSFAGTSQTLFETSKPTSGATPPIEEELRYSFQFSRLEGALAALKEITSEMGEAFKTLVGVTQPPADYHLLAVTYHTKASTSQPTVTSSEATIDVTVGGPAPETAAVTTAADISLPADTIIAMHYLGQSSGHLATIRSLISTSTVSTPIPTIIVVSAPCKPY